MVNKILIYFSSLIALLLLGIIGFWHFEFMWFYKVLILGMAILAFIWYFWQGKVDFIIYLIFALLIYNMDNLNLISNWQLFLIILAIIAVSSWLFYLLLYFDSGLTIPFGMMIFYLLLFDLFYVEIFVTLSYWPANPISKSVILVSIFYFLYQTIFLRLTNMLQLKKLLPYFLVSGVAIILIISTTQWYGL